MESGLNESDKQGTPLKVALASGYVYNKRCIKCAGLRGVIALYLLSRKEIRMWIDFMVDGGNEVIGTKKVEGQYVYEKLDSSDTFSFDYLPTNLPVKDFLLPRREEKVELNKRLASLDASDQKRERLMPMTFFGLRECDLASISIVDKAELTPKARAYYNSRREHSQFYVFDCREVLDKHCFCYLLHDKDYTQADGVFYTFFDGYCVDLKSQVAKSTFAAFLRAYPTVSLEEVHYNQSVWHYRYKMMTPLDQSDPRARLVEACAELIETCGEREICNTVCPTTLRDGLKIKKNSNEKKYRPLKINREGLTCVGCGRCTRYGTLEETMKKSVLRMAEVKVET